MKLHSHWLKPLLLGLVAGLVGFGCQKPSTAAASSEYQPEPVRSQSNANPDELLKPADRTFIKAAEDNDLRDRDFGREAEAKTQSRDVRSFAKTIANDQTHDLQRVVQLMSDKGIHEAKDMVAVNHRALTRLNKVPGQSVDRTFLDLMIQDQEKEVADYQAEANGGVDPAVRQYAADALKTLQKHLNKAKDLEARLASK